MEGLLFIYWNYALKNVNFQNTFTFFYCDLCISKNLNDTIITPYYYVYTALLTELSVGVPIIDDPRDVLTGVAARFFLMT